MVALGLISTLPVREAEEQPPVVVTVKLKIPTVAADPEIVKIPPEKFPEIPDGSPLTVAPVPPFPMT